MKESVYTVVSNDRIAGAYWKMTLSGDSSGISRGGQFVDIMIEGCYLRRPIAVLEWDKNWFSIIYKVVGKGTDILSKICKGGTLNILTGLGNGFDDKACIGKALIVCGGVGASPAFSLAKRLIADGKKVTAILGFNTKSEVILFDEYRKLGADTHVVTMDGSEGTKGFVTDALKELDPEFDYFYTCGPKVMMKAVCDYIQGPGEVSLEERMGCGCGICYGCTCHTTNGARRVCADGPVFKKEEVIW